MRTLPLLIMMIISTMLLVDAWISSSNNIRNSLCQKSIDASTRKRRISFSFSSSSSSSSSSTTITTRQSVFRLNGKKIKKAKGGDDIDEDITAGARSTFEYQEMRAILYAMKEKNVASRNMPMDKRMEVAKYIEKVITTTRQESSLKRYKDYLSTIGDQIPNTKWRLTFSTEAATLGDLPNDATIFLKVYDRNKLDYTLQFSEKTFGLNSITAKCNYVFDAGPTNPGLVTFIYNEITTDAFGFSGLGVGFFGLLKGRANYVESVYFDDRHWIEYGVDPTGERGYYNVYVKVEDDE